ncbi:SMI1/KNR4 family protein [Actinokineospora sp. HUAS TT18]|uniref:SMI1/KNR4 family protein n=1 Tax=Actinokineospora sp. HUAS TT18 TaxID=3447451 RepID=UPI003F52041C
MTSAADFPPALAAVARVEFPYDRDEDIDYEPHDSFMAADETTDWLRAWTGNPDADTDFRVFGQDGTGGYAAFWLVRPDAPVEGQPVVFLGSEGEHGVVARNLAAYLWLLADGQGPMEAVAYGDLTSNPRPELVAIAEKYAAGSRQSASQILTEAKAEFPDFDALIAGLIR